MYRFENNGGKIIPQFINSFSELQGNYDVVFNCTGLGAKNLCSDKKLVPIRGQVIKVKAPWLKTAFYGDDDTYIIPGLNGIATLGGTRQFESYKMKIDKYDSASIREKCEQLVPSLIGAPVVREVVGLRPHRDPVRVETDYYSVNDNSPVKIIHNYGHGGYGVTTCPGTSKYAVSLVKELLA